MLKRRRPAALDGLARLDEKVCAALRARLADVGFTAALIAEAEAFFPGVLRGPRLPLIRWWLERRPEAGATLARLFLYDATRGAPRGPPPWRTPASSRARRTAASRPRSSSTRGSTACWCSPTAWGAAPTR
jgi:hypothetical protein